MHASAGAVRWRSLNQPGSCSDACDVGGEEVDAVPVEVPARSVVVLGGARVGVSSKDLASRSGTPASRALVIAACRSECGLMWRGTPAAFAIRTTIRYTSRRSIGLPDIGRRINDPSVRSPRHASSTRSTGTVTGMVAGLLPLPTRCHRCSRRSCRRLVIPPAGSDGASAQRDLDGDPRCGRRTHLEVVPV
jgi:hypothetical protein